MVRLYIPQSLNPGEEIELPANPAAHVRARRLDCGAVVTLFNGAGGEYSGTLGSVQRRRITVHIGQHSPIERELPYSVLVLQAVIKGERMDMAVEKAAELGAAQIIPVLSQRCVVRLDDDKRAAKRQRHWQAVAASACEQCGRNRLPHIHAPMPLDQAWYLLDGYPCRLLLNPQARQPLSALVRPVATALLIGPEGGLNEAEWDAAGRHAFEPAYAGTRVMRTETATIAALSTFASCCGEM